MSALNTRTACDLVDMISNRTVSCVEVMRDHFDRIEAVNGAVNAICSLIDRRVAIVRAKDADAQVRSGETLGPLHGLPIAVKDLVDVAGMLTTYGSPIFKTNRATTDALFVERLRNAGAIIIGKTNTPEFGAGSHTFNPVHGLTRNPWALTRSAGGSSGGAGAALASRMLPIADGSDFGGSLRNPGAWNNVVGFRPSIGRVPETTRVQQFADLPVSGPMGRTVADTALLFSVMAGPHLRDSASLPEPGGSFFPVPMSDFDKTRIGWTLDLGLYPVEAEVVRVTEQALPTLHDIGCIVDDTHPDLNGAYDAYKVLRAATFEAMMRPFYDAQKDKIKETLIWNVELGRAQSSGDVSKALDTIADLQQRMASFFETHDFLVMPTTQIAPFPAAMEYPTEINGEPLETYLDWMQSCIVISATTCPAISVPCGFTEDGLPLGLQIVGPVGADLKVLQFAQAFEAATGYGQRAPRT